METIKQLFKLRYRVSYFSVDSIKEAVLRSFDKIQQIEVVAHSRQDYRQRTQLIAEIFLEHLQDQRQKFIDRMLQTVSSLEESNQNLKTQTEFLRMTAEESTRKANSLREDAKSRQLYELLNVSDDQNFHEIHISRMKRELAEKYEKTMQQGTEKYRIEIARLRSKNEELEGRIQELVSEISQGNLIRSLSLEDSQEIAIDFMKNARMFSSPSNNYCKKTFNDTADVTPCKTPVKFEDSGSLVFKYIKSPVRLV